MANDLTPEELAELEALRAEQKDLPLDISPAQTALESFGQSATMGYLPQIQAGIEKGISNIAELIPGTPQAQDVQLREQGFQLPEDSYASMREENIARQQEQAEENPLAALTGMIGGAVSSAPLIGGGISQLGKIKGLGSLKGLGELIKGTRAAQAIKTGKILPAAAEGFATGATTGALYNPGDPIEGSEDPLQLKERLGKAAVSGITGGAISPAAAAISKVGRIGKAVKMAQDEATLAPKVKAEINKTLTKLKDPITQSVAKAEAALTKQPVPVDTTQLRRVKSAKVDRMVKIAEKNTKKYGQAALPPREALYLRRELDKLAQRPVTPVYGSAVRGRDPAKTAADNLRESIRQLNPKSAENLEKASQIMDLRSFLKQKSQTNPVEAITIPEVTTRGSNIAQLDEIAGTDLRGLGQDLATAKSMLNPQPGLNVAGLVGPIAAPVSKAVSTLTGNRPVQTLLQEGEVPLIQLLNEAYRRRRNE